MLVDAPCSGSGTWRRGNPEARWRLTPERLDRTVALQARIIGYAASLVKPGGRLVFAVCSLIDREGHDQVEAFPAHRPNWAPVLRRMGSRARSRHIIVARRDGTDGFFATLANN